MKTPNALVIHGHFYQPPRENPWTDAIARQPGAQPYHDWNERIYRECYRPNAHARVVDGHGRVERLVNNYEYLSFNLGPTLLNWLARHHPDTYERVLEADRRSVRRRHGHGNAIAQGYHHAILPLCNERDLRTEIRWGLTDFRQRFKRDAESLWLPETACNAHTLGALIDENLRYVILSPFQAERVRPLGVEVWQSVVDGNLDTTVPYRFCHPDGSGRALTIFFYDGEVAKGIAFDGLLASSHFLVERCARAVHERTTTSAQPQLVNVATDGESYGHHYRYGDRCVAYALTEEAATRNFHVTNYGEFLAEYPPRWEVEIKEGPGGEGTAWSCAHGVGRWTRDCSCHAGAQEGWNQHWRAPLRAALNFLRDESARHFETLGAKLFRDPWAARDAYVEVLIDASLDRTAWLAAQSKRPLSEDEQVSALTLLEMQRSALMMYTSCGWFFNDISGIETLQVLKYAERVLELLEDLGVEPPRAGFLALLAEARGNVAAHGDGSQIFARAIKSSRVTPARVAASLAIASLVDDREETGVIAGYDFQRTDFRTQQHGRLALATARLRLTVRATGQRHDFAVASMHFGDVDFYCVLRPYPGAEMFAASAAKVWLHFRIGSLPAMLQLMREEFGEDDYGLEHLLPEGRHRVYEIVFGQMIERFSEQYEFLYEENRRNVEMLQAAGFELPPELRAAAEFTMSRRFESELLEQERNAADSSDPSAYREALKIAEDAARHHYRLDRTRAGARFAGLLTRAVRHASEHPNAEHLRDALELHALAQRLGLAADFERAQEIVYEALQPDEADAQSGTVVSPLVAATRRDASVASLLRELLAALNLSPLLLNALESGEEAEAA